MKIPRIAEWKFGVGDRMSWHRPQAPPWEPQSSFEEELREFDINLEGETLERYRAWAAKRVEFLIKNGENGT